MEKDNQTIVIAEAGVNHNGKIDLAKKLIEEAAKAKADYIKFQTFKAERLASENTAKTKYQIKNSNDPNQSQFNMLKDLELTENDHFKLINYCKEKDIKFLSSAFDVEGLNFLNTLSLDFFKIPSGEITNFPYLKTISKFERPVILSTGMCSMKEIKNALDILTSHKLKKCDITILHCNTDYPTNYNDVNLQLMNLIKNEFNIKVGYSDHTLGIEVPIAAVAMGASVIEKHFTLDKSLPGPDHKASLNPLELSEMIKSIRNIEKSVSNKKSKSPTKSELENIKFIRKSLHLNKNLKKGDIIRENDLITLRPATGINPMDWNKVINRVLNNDINKGNPLKWKDLNNE
tara:strand:+ start:134 stop:1171 length:1038 start_codon:yes stop_codon:yes gene_type:complete